MVRVITTAPRGGMGSLIIQEVIKNKDLILAGCVGRPGSDYIGMDAGLAAGLDEKTGVAVTHDIENIIDDCDLVIDFSTISLGMDILKQCIKHKKALIIGTTGFNEEQTQAILKAADTIPVMKAANTSYAVGVMMELLRKAAASLDGKCSIDIIDYHSETKLDAPSGTALEMADAMYEAMDQAGTGAANTDEVISGAGGNAADKGKGTIKHHSVRTGNIPSSHQVVFGCMGEKIEIRHDAYDWSCFAAGACEAAVFLAGKAPGSYSMKDVFECKKYK